ncbi:hypothetical protein ES332_A05G334100v1, partial [Gossypium tomentosum]
IFHFLSFPETTSSPPPIFFIFRSVWVSKGTHFTAVVEPPPYTVAGVPKSPFFRPIWPSLPRFKTPKLLIKNKTKDNKPSVSSSNLKKGDWSKLRSRWLTRAVEQAWCDGTGGRGGS